jgi:hypothetical protein
MVSEFCNFFHLALQPQNQSHVKHNNDISGMYLLN